MHDLTYVRNTISSVSEANQEMTYQLKTLNGVGESVWYSVFTDHVLTGPDLTPIMTYDELNRWAENLITQSTVVLINACLRRMNAGKKSKFSVEFTSENMGILYVCAYTTNDFIPLTVRLDTRDLLNLLQVLEDSNE